MVVGLVLLAATLCPTRAPGQSAARNGMVDALYYVLAIGFLYDKVCHRSSSSAGTFTVRTSPDCCQRRSVDDSPTDPIVLKRSMHKSSRMLP